MLNENHYILRDFKEKIYFKCLFSVFLRRTFVGIFLQNALPNMLLSIVVFSSNLYYNERFEAAIAVNVTCLLAMSGKI